MSKIDFENKSLVIIILIGYAFNLVFSSIGYLSNYGSSEQMLFYQIGNAFAISASVMAGRYTGLRGQHVAASAYILLGITHGISLAALTKSGINFERGATMAIPMVPSLFFMFWCNLYPMWLRVLGIIPIALCILLYVGIQSGKPTFEWALSSGYAIFEIMEVIWAVFLFKDWYKITHDNHVKN